MARSRRNPGNRPAAVDSGPGDTAPPTIGERLREVAIKITALEPQKASSDAAVRRLVELYDEQARLREALREEEGR